MSRELKNTTKRLGLACSIQGALVVLCFLSAVKVRAQVAGEAETSVAPRNWAILIGVEKYHRASRLQYTVNDVQQLAHTLHYRGNYLEKNLLQIVDTAQNPRFQPLRASIMDELPKFLAKPGPNDQILVYFSGHGFQDGEGKLYLAPIDCNPKDPAPTGISVEWFRQQLAACKAKVKLLILDACHAGTEKSDDDLDSVAADALGELFRDASGVVTLASSAKNEKSQIWDDQQQSLFSYWLNQGLKGHADTNGDTQVTIDELYNYVHRNVTHTAEVRFPRPQTPVRIVRSGTLGIPVALTLTPVSLRQVLADMAEQLALFAEEHQLASVGVLEFANITDSGELLGAEFGLLGRYCADELEQQLIGLGQGKFSVVSRDRLQSALATQQFAVKDFASGEALTRLAKSAGGMPAIARGTLSGRKGRQITLRCKLVQTGALEDAGMAGGTAWLSPDEWAMLGRSVVFKPEDRRPEAPVEGQPSRPIVDQVVTRVDRRSRGPHPLADPAFRFPIRIMVAGKPRPGKLKGNDYFVALRRGEVYEIEVQNRSDQMVSMRLLVDGLDTLPHNQTVKGVSTNVTAPRVNLDEARSWVLDPNADRVFRKDGYPTWSIRGFVTATGIGGQGKLREFTVVDASQSLAARRQYTDQIGLITAAFYLPGGGTRGSIGTWGGTERTEDIVDYQGPPPRGNLISVVHIRYVDASEISP